MEESTANPHEVSSSNIVALKSQASNVRDQLRQEEEKAAVEDKVSSNDFMWPVGDYYADYLAVWLLFLLTSLLQFFYFVRDISIVVLSIFSMIYVLRYIKNIFGLNATLLQNGKFLH